MPDTRAHYVIEDTAGAAPFAPGERVVYRDEPERGALTVDRCYWTHAHWRVDWSAAAAGASGSAPADHLAACPPDWTEPPQRPAGSVRWGLSYEDERAARERDLANPEYRAAYSHWEAAMRRWLERWSPR